MDEGLAAEGVSPASREYKVAFICTKNASRSQVAEPEFKLEL